ncbi:MAG: glutaminase domain-containing protein [Phycisphaeraceae bacterium]
MQLMSWQIARLGSRFGMLFEPYKQRVMHGAMGRLLDRPMDLCVGMVEPDGTERTLPFTALGKPLVNCEQFERFNSITYRGYSGKHNIRFELNIHSPFYPQDEKLCLLPVFYLEFRVHHVIHARWRQQAAEPDMNVRLFLRVNRPDTQVFVDEGQIHMRYDNHLSFNADRSSPFPETNPPPQGGPTVRALERIVSLNPEAEPTPEGDGLTIRMPVTMPDQGSKWRLLWCAHVSEPIAKVRRQGDKLYDAHFRYVDHWPTIDDAVQEARATRDDHLAHSRRVEKLVQQAPMNIAQQHLVNQAWQSYLANTFWLSHEDPGVEDDKCPADARASWFSVVEGSRLLQSNLNAECNAAMFYLAMWPRLLKMLLRQFLERVGEHEPSDGAIVDHDLGSALDLTAPAYDHPSPTDQNADLLALVQTYSRWAGDTSLVRDHHETLTKLANFLSWTDRDHSGFPSTGVSTTHGSRYSPAFRSSPKQTYLAVKRSVGLRAAADLLKHAGTPDVAPKAKAFEQEGERAADKIVKEAWYGDHFMVCVDPAFTADVGRDLGNVYCIYNANAELLPLMVGMPTALPDELLVQDLASGKRETMRRYGCCNTTLETDHLRISQNLWRDMLARYLKVPWRSSASHYWDMQVMCNTHLQSKGFVDAYITDNLAHYPRGVTALGYLLAGPRLIIDRLAPGSGGTYITIDPDRTRAARWPLMPLADWKAGKVPIAVVTEDGKVRIESELDQIIIHGQDKPSSEGLIG